MEGFTIKSLGVIAANRYKSLDPEILENYYNLIYDPVKYHIYDFSNSVGCLLNIGSWKMATATIAETQVGEFMENFPQTFQSGWERVLFSCIDRSCSAGILSEPVNNISKAAFIAGDLELTFIKENDLQDQIGTIIGIANQSLIDKQFQTELELTRDSESEEWKTLLFRFYVNVTIEEFMSYQTELVRKFVYSIEPNKRKYFSLLIEPV